VDSPVVAAVESRAGVSGRVRMAAIPNFKQTTMIAFVKQHVRPGSIVHTDGLKGFEELQAAGVKHVRRTQPRQGALLKGAPSVVPLESIQLNLKLTRILGPERS
jgi:transposase-like protein